MSLQDHHRSLTTRKRRFKSPPPQQWLDLKQRITFLYCEMDMNLEDVMKLMRLEYQFDATVKMYKSHITAWDLRKNLRVHEAQAMLCRKHILNRSGIDCLFLVRGQLADMSDIERCCRRAKRANFDDAEDEALPEGIDCIVFKYRITALTDPDAFNQLHRFLHYNSVYVEGSLDSGSWVPDPNHGIIECCNDTEILLVQRCISRMGAASRYFNRGEHDLGGACAREAFRMLPRLVATPHETTTSALLLLLLSMQTRDQQDLKRMTVATLARLALVELSPSHPFGQVLRTLTTIATDDIEPLLDIYRTFRKEFYARKAGFTHFDDFSSSNPQYSSSSHVGTLEQIQDDLNKICGKYGTRSWIALKVRGYYGERLEEAERWKDAEVVLRDLLNKYSRSNFYSLYLIDTKLRHGRALSHLKDHRAAKTAFQGAFEVATKLKFVPHQLWFKILESLARVCRVLHETEEAQIYERLKNGMKQDILNQDRQQLLLDGIEIPNTGV